MFLEVPVKLNEKYVVKVEEEFSRLTLNIQARELWDTSVTKLLPQQ